MKRLIDFSSRFRILKGGKISLVVSALLGGAVLASASPSEGTLTNGSATISQNGTVTNINQSSQKASINWQSFSIASNETVNFNQPNSSSITLNRVIGNERSVIDGALNANGQVWILNSNGVLFGKNASINTSGILATTAQLSDSDFQNGNYNFKNSSSNSVINEGTITISDAGSVILASNEVRNSGTIKAVKGKVHLTGASDYTINLNGNSLVNLKVEKGVLDAMVENSGTILADGGEIYLTTNAVDELLKGVVNNTGVIEANSLDGLTGKVELFAHGGTAEIGGTIEAVGGFVETSGDKVKINNDFRVKAKEWLIDPVDFTIAASGGDIDGTTLSANLENADVTIQSLNGWTGTNGDIFVNDAISWTSDYDLTLNASRNIAINADITATGTGGKLSLLYGQSSAGGGANDDYTLASGVAIDLQAGQNFSTQKGSTGSVIDYTVINGADNSAIATALQNMNNNPNDKYALGANVDLTGIAWTPIGPVWVGPHFTGLFDGLGHTVDHLTINDTANQYRGFFGITDSGSVIKNVGLTNVNIIGGHGTGALAGVVQGKVFNVYSTGSVTGLRQVGGLVGNMANGAILSNSYSSANINFIVIPAETNDNLGGIVGYNAGTISNSYATGNVVDSSNSGTPRGGFVGYNANTGAISNSYFIGTITNGDGGFVGTNLGSIVSSFWDTTLNAGLTDAYATGLTTAEFADASNFSTWDSTVWSFTDSTVAGYGMASRPFLAKVTTNADKPSIASTLFAGGYGTNVDPYTMTTATHLQNMGNTNVVGQDYYYNLSNDIDLTGVTWSAIGNSLALYSFKGTFDGQNHTIDNLTMNIASAHKGFFGVIGIEGEVKNIGLTNSSINISNSDFAGVLAGTNQGIISNAYSTGNIISTGSTYIGGLVGFNNGGTIEDSYSTTNVINDASQTGGLVGENRGTIRRSYATGDVDSGTTGSHIGGLVGRNTNNISNSYATGAVGGNDSVGGLVGVNSGTVQYSYSIGVITGTTNVGGLIGGNTGTVTNSLWDILTTGITDGLGQGKGYAHNTTGTNGMDTIDTYDTYGWDIEIDNTLSSSYKYPVLSVFNGGGSKIWKIKAVSSTGGSSTPTPTPTNNEDVNKVVTAIVNTNAIKVEAPKFVALVIQPQAQIKTTIAPTIDMGFGQGTKVALVSQPQENQPTKMITMSELKSMQPQPANENSQQNSDGTPVVQDVRVSVGDNSIIDLVNGGVNLPDGVEQEFYVVEDTRN